MFDLKKMASGALKSYGMKKLGLGVLNPLLGLASLFGLEIAALLLPEAFVSIVSYCSALWLHAPLA